MFTETELEIPWLVAVLDYYEKTHDLEKTRNRMCGDTSSDDEDN